MSNFSRKHTGKIQIFTGRSGRRRKMHVGDLNESLFSFILEAKQKKDCSMCVADLLTDAGIE